jgi:hypothetical protein
VSLKWGCGDTGINSQNELANNHNDPLCRAFRGQCNLEHLHQRKQLLRSTETPSLGLRMYDFLSQHNIHTHVCCTSHLFVYEFALYFQIICWPFHLLDFVATDTATPTTSSIENSKQTKRQQLINWWKKAKVSCSLWTLKSYLMMMPHWCQHKLLNHCPLLLSNFSNLTHQNVHCRASTQQWHWCKGFF